MKIHRISVGLLGTNCYIWEDEKTKNAIVVDAPADADKIIEFADEKGVKITDIFLTHGHFDHILALKELKEKTGATISMFEKTEALMADSEKNMGGLVGVKCEFVKADRFLYNCEEIDFYGNKIKVIHTPGHTEDSVCYLNEKTLISGDTLFRFSVGRTDGPTGNGEEEIFSIREKLMTLDDDVKVYPGHGEETTIGEERRGNPYI